MKHLIYIVVLLTMLVNTSCYRNIRYIVDDKTPLPHEYTDSTTDYLVRSGDRLGISLLSTNQDINSLFSSSVLQNSNMSSSSSGGVRGGFLVSDSGFVLLPIFGNVSVAGKTINQIRTDLQFKTDSKLIDAVVTVNLLNFDVYFLGASKNVRVNFDKTKVNILEAVAQTGGLSYEGRRRKIMIIRKTQNGHSLQRIDITDRNIIEASQFYLQPNDIVYIEPRRFTSLSNGLKNYTTILSIVSSALTTYYLLSRLK